MQNVSVNLRVWPGNLPSWRNDNAPSLLKSDPDKGRSGQAASYLSSRIDVRPPPDPCSASVDILTSVEERILKLARFARRGLRPSRASCLAHSSPGTTASTSCAHMGSVCSKLCGVYVSWVTALGVIPEQCGEQVGKRSRACGLGSSVIAWLASGRVAAGWCARRRFIRSFKSAEPASGHETCDKIVHLVAPAPSQRRPSAAAPCQLRELALSVCLGLNSASIASIRQQRRITFQPGSCGSCGYERLDTPAAGSVANAPRSLSNQTTRHEHTPKSMATHSAPQLWGLRRLRALFVVVVPSGSRPRRRRGVLSIGIPASKGCMHAHPALSWLDLHS